MRKRSRHLVLLWVAAAFALAVLSGCSPKTTPVDTQVRTDTVRDILWRTDTVINSDSVRTIVKSDSVITEIVRWRVRVRERHDTIYKSSKDSIVVPMPYPVEIVKEIERPRRWWETALIWLGVMTVAAALTFIFVKTVKSRK